MWNCFKHRCVLANISNWQKPISKQLRLISDDETAKAVEAKNLAMWSKQVGNLVRKREMLSLISEYIRLQQRYVDSRLRSNKKLLEYVIKYWNIRSKESH